MGIGKEDCKGIKTVLTIAGSDSSGGAGIQADLKTITAHGLYGMSVVTAVTAQNTTGVSGIFKLPPAFVRKQLDAVFQDIFPDAVKIGMLSDRETIQVVADVLREYRPPWVVVDPVMISTSGSRLLDEKAVHCLVTELVPWVDLITPNLPEGEVLSGRSITGKSEMMRAAEMLAEQFSTAVLLKGGHLTDTADDLLYQKGEYRWYPGERIHQPNTHGTGCTLSSAIACHLAAGHSLWESAALAKEYVQGAIQAGLELGNGNGPLYHMWHLA